MQRPVMENNLQLKPPNARELAQLKTALLANRDGILTTTCQRLARIARARGVEPDAIDDVIQETLFEAWGHLERLHTPAGFALWIDEICRNVCRRAARRRETSLAHHVSLQPSFGTEPEQDPPEMDLVAEGSDPLDALVREDMLLLLDRALGSLAPDARQLLEMCYLLELGHTEIAARLHLTSSALDVRLHRARRALYQILNGPLRAQAAGFGFKLNEALGEGWQPTRLWCPLCARQRLEGMFMLPEADDGPNLHLRCPDCARLYHFDTVHSMGLVPLAELHSFRPAWKRTMQSLTDRIGHALQQGQHACLFCGQPATICVQGAESSAASSDSGEPRPYASRPYAYWIYMQCGACGNVFDTCGNLPSVDQLVYWSHPRSRQFINKHTHWQSEPTRRVEYEGLPALQFELVDVASSEHLTVVANRQTLQILTTSS